MSVLIEHEEVPAATGGPGKCEAIIQWLDAECGQPSAGLYRRICVHEHVIHGRLCQGHVDDVAFGICKTCVELGGDLSHECPINIAEVTG